MNSRLRDNAWFGGFLLATGSILLLAIGIAQGKDSAWWAAWGQWVGGVGSIAAAWVALWIAIKGWRRSDQENIERARKQAEIEQRDQASKVAVWIEDEHPNDAGRAAVFFANNSGLPIHNAFITIRLSPVRSREIPHKDREIRWQYESLGPTQEKELLRRATKRINEKISEHLERAYGKDWQTNREKMQLAVDDYLDFIGEIKTMLSFRDNAGLTWIRLPDGRLLNAKGKLVGALALTAFDYAPGEIDTLITSFENRSTG